MSNTFHWIIEDSFTFDKGHQELIQIVQKMDIPHTLVKVRPISHEIIPDVPDSVPVFVVGSILLMRIAQERHWMPGVFYGPSFEVEEWMKGYGEYTLNHDAQIMELKDVPPFEGNMFIRPNGGTKSFTGKIFNSRDLRKMQKGAKLGGSSQCAALPSTEVAVSRVKEIFQEARFFIVDGKVVTDTIYAIGRRVTSKVPVPLELQEFALKMISHWEPDRAYCLDLALTPEGPRIVEINCINAAGFYESNIGLLVDAINNMPIIPPVKCKKNT